MNGGSKVGLPALGWDGRKLNWKRVIQGGQTEYIKQKQHLYYKKKKGKKEKGQLVKKTVHAHSEGVWFNWKVTAKANKRHGVTLCLNKQ